MGCGPTMRPARTRKVGHGHFVLVGVGRHLDEKFEQPLQAGLVHGRQQDHDQLQSVHLGWKRREGRGGGGSDGCVRGLAPRLAFASATASS